VYGAGVFALDKAGVHDFASPWLWSALAPLILIYVCERMGWISMFKGFSLPTLLLWASANLLVWVLHTHAYVSVWVVYIILGVFLAALVFALLRLWTYQDRSSSSLQ
jgi:hypothetical protein